MLEVKKISFLYKLDGHNELEAIRNISFSLDENEFLRLTGPSGSGKSTIGKIAAGLLKPAKGSVTVNNCPVHFDSGWQGVGYTFQNPENQFFMNDVYQEIICGPLNIGYNLDEADEIASFIIEKLSLREIKNRKIQILSGGEKQKVAIAAMLAMKPKYLILDEPTSMLDKASTKELAEYLIKIKEEWGMGMLAITQRHELDEFADRCLTIDQNGMLE